MKKPVILSNIEAHRNVVGKEDYVVFLSKVEPESIANGIKKAYQQREFLSANAVKARKLVLQEYTWEAQAEKLISFFKKLLM